MHICMFVVCMYALMLMYRFVCIDIWVCKYINALTDVCVSACSLLCIWMSEFAFVCTWQWFLPVYAMSVDICVPMFLCVFVSVCLARVIALTFLTPLVFVIFSLFHFLWGRTDPCFKLHYISVFPLVYLSLFMPVCLCAFLCSLVCLGMSVRCLSIRRDSRAPVHCRMWI